MNINLRIISLKFLVVIILLALVVFALFIGFQLGVKNTKNTVVTVVKEVPKKFLGFIDLPEEPQPLVLTPVLKDLINPFTSQKLYPKQLQDLSAGVLKCSSVYKLFSEDKNYKYKDDLGNELKDKNLIEFLNKTNQYILMETAKDLSFAVNTIQLCQQQTGTNSSFDFYFYSIQDRGGGAGRSNYIHHIGSQLPAFRFRYNAPYSSCSNLLFSDLSYNIYLQCSGGDGPAGSKAIYRINLTSRESIKLYECTMFEEKTMCNF